MAIFAEFLAALFRAAKRRRVEGSPSEADSERRLEVQADQEDEEAEEEEEEG